MFNKMVIIMQNVYFSFFGLLLLGCSAAKEPTTTPASTKPKLLWSDEFDYQGLPDPALWTYDVGGQGWGNQELQFYTEKRLENARVEGGNLIIEARKEKMEGNNYTSARLVTRGKKPIRYGRVEVRAKLPRGVGTWPAIWMLGNNISTVSWPLCGEIDVMEHVGFDQDRVHGSVHTQAYHHSIGTHKSANRVLPGVSDNFHVYAVNWTPNRIDISMDGATYFTFAKESNDPAKWPFDQDMFLLLNIAVGGAWGGQKGVDDLVFPQRMEVDYVRVYE